MTIVGLIVFAQGDLFAQQSGKGMNMKMEERTMMGKGQMQGQGMMGGKMMGEGMMCGPMGMCPMQAMMMKQMMSRTILETEDGGIVVMMGNRIVKYDKKLNLVGEVELKVDMEKMHAMMKKMMEECPMCREMMEKCGKMGMHGMKQAEEVEEETETP